MRITDVCSFVRTCILWCASCVFTFLQTIAESDRRGSRVLCNYRVPECKNKVRQRHIMIDVILNRPAQQQKTSVSTLTGATAGGAGHFYTGITWCGVRVNICFQSSCQSHPKPQYHCWESGHQVSGAYCTLGNARPPKPPSKTMCILGIQSQSERPGIIIGEKNTNFIIPGMYVTTPVFSRIEFHILHSPSRSIEFLCVCLPVLLTIQKTVNGRQHSNIHFIGILAAIPHTA